MDPKVLLEIIGKIEELKELVYKKYEDELKEKKHWIQNHQSVHDIWHDLMPYMRQQVCMERTQRIRRIFQMREMFW